MKLPGTVPLARALSKLGIASRAEAAALIREGRVAAVEQVTARGRELPILASAASGS